MRCDDPLPFRIATSAFFFFVDLKKKKKKIIQLQQRQVSVVVKCFGPIVLFPPVKGFSVCG